MNLVELNAIKLHLKKQLAQMNEIPVNCQSCTKLSFSKCQEFNESPPDHWITGVVDCESWVWDGVPF